MILMRVALAFLIGVVGHQSNRLFANWESSNAAAWVLLGRYSVGVIMIWMAMAILCPRRHLEMVTHIYFASAVAIGSGVAAGYVMDEL